MATPKKRGFVRHSSWFSQKKSQPQEVRQALPGRDIAVAEQHFGKAYVNCCLRGNKSTWGKFRDKDAAILQLLITPRQDNGFKLKELALELCFSESDPTKESNPRTNGQPSLVILEPPSPKYLRGKAVTQHCSRELLAQPQVGAGAISIGGIGLRTTKNQDTERAWHFQSHWSNNNTGTYTNAQWTWQAVAKNPDIEDVGVLYAGVVIQHPGQPFYITCKVNGKLVSLGRKYMYGNNGGRPYHTCVHPQSSTKSIEKEAEGLESKIVDLIAGAAARIIEAVHYEDNAVVQ